MLDTYENTKVFEERERQTVSYYNKEFKTEIQDIKENKLQQQEH